jgi:double-strand break repair protein MRE11
MEIYSNKSPFDEENTLKILVTTDNHMGYRETDLIVGEDSFNSFEECLKIANDENVDFVLLGGDLFHE